MSSSNKTSYLGLNQFVGSDKPKMEDFNADNRLLDEKMQQHVQSQLHLTEQQKERLENLLQAESGEDVFRTINSSSYGNKIDNDEFSYIEDDIRRLNAYHNKQLLRFSSNAPAVVYCFMSLAQIELTNITNIIEGVRYDLSAEEIRKLLVLF